MDDINYLKVGNKTYTLTEIEGENIDIDAELREFYEAKEQTLAKDFGKALTDNAIEDWNTQIAHLQKYDGRGRIMIKRQDFNKLLYVYNNIMMEARVILYSPNEISTDYSWLSQYWSEDELRDSGIVSGMNVLLKVRPMFSIPLLLIYDAKVNKMYTPNIRTYHTFSYGDICTGNHTAKDFWDMPISAFSSAINRINTFSPAVGSMHIGMHTYRLSDISRPANVIEVHRREDVQWRA